MTRPAERGDRHGTGAALADGRRPEHGEREGQRGRWVGAAMARKEDPRMLRGSGRFVGDLARIGMLHAAFVRSPFAAARVSAIGTSAALRAPGVAAAFTAADLGHPYLLATLERDEFVPTQMPLLAGDQVRFDDHLDICVGCRSHLGEVRVTVQVVSSLATERPSFELEASLRGQQLEQPLPLGVRDLERPSHQVGQSLGIGR